MKHLLTLLFLITGSSLFAQNCAAGYSEIIIQIVPDAYDYETSWDVISNGTTIASGTYNSDTVCVLDNSCVQVLIHDAYGDGIFSPGGYWVYLNGTQIATGNSFGSEAVHEVACPQGSTCAQPFPITTGTFTTQFEDTWYTYTPSISGMYALSTCGINTCNTALWVFESCPIVGITDGPMGSYAFNDDAASCGVQSAVNVMMIAGHTYIIRVGDVGDACSGNINFNFTYNGPIVGCMDPTSCNFNPLATADDGSCIYFPDPGCEGPDLQFDSAAFVSSLFLSTHTTSGCDISEDCVTGYGLRYVIQFSSKINNIGTTDYYIGTPASQPGQFNTTNCHGHAHYEGYGDYRLYDAENNIIPAGHKNGFCVMDLCGFGQYNCGDMGISAGCYDIYGAGTQCQWIDITDVPEGDYRLAVIINSQHLPDALGRNEINYLNNALQVCIHISRDANNVPSYTLLPNCTPFVDCEGTPGGMSIMDCNGECGGTAMFGNTVEDELVNAQDLSGYFNMFQQDNAPALPCYDLNSNDALTVYDAALEAWCLSSAGTGSGMSHCYFPRDVINPSDTTGVAITSANFNSNYIDVELRSPRADIIAWQFRVSGIHMTDVVALTSEIDMPMLLGKNVSRSEVFGLYNGDSVLHRSTSAHPICRIYFDQITADEICIESIQDIPNKNGERTVTEIYGNCIDKPVGIQSIQERAHLTIMPNPAKDIAYVNVPDGSSWKGSWELIDATGRVVKRVLPTTAHQAQLFAIPLGDLSNGVYILRIQDINGKVAVGRLVKN
ncbi:MAG: hypothetical protein RLZZ543_1211 [Bacteroidota bacterium]|jgi:hypothetical protein